LSSALTSALKKVTGLELGVDVSGGFGSVMSIKDNFAKDCQMRASDHSGKVLKKYVMPMIEEMIDAEGKVAQTEFSDKTEDAIKDPTKIKGLNEQLLQELHQGHVDSCYTPIIQSGSGDDKFDLKPSAQSTSNPLAYDSGSTLIIQLGVRYKNYCSNIGRTYFINPTEDQKRNYMVLIEVYLACKKAMRAGNIIKNV
jgi:nucleosome binding factor SPN SPT16 subunit